jgi:hypothetical protein
MVLERSIPEEGTAGEQQLKTQTTKEGRKAVQCRDQKHRRQGQYNVEVPFMKVITDIMGMSPRRRGNCDMPVGYLGRAALRRD